MKEDNTRMKAVTHIVSLTGILSNLLVPVACILLFTSCGSTTSMFFADKRMKEIAVGMDKSEVVGILGEYYLVNSSSKDAEGNLTEVLVYKSSPNEEYRLKFLNNKLDSWNRVHLREYIQPETVPPTSN